MWALITVTLRCHHNGDDKTIKIYKEQKNVTVKCNTAARQTRKIKTFQLESCASFLYVKWTSELRNFKLDVFSHRSDSLAAKYYCVLWQMPSSILFQQLQLQHYKRLTHSLHCWNFIASSHFSCIYYSFIIYITQYPGNEWKIIIKKKSSSF